MNGEGPWTVGGRVYRDWSRLPDWYRRRLRSASRQRRARERYDGLLGRTVGWRRTALGLALGAGVTLAIAECLWRL